MENRMEILINIPEQARVIKTGAGLDTRSSRTAHNVVLAVSSQGYKEYYFSSVQNLQQFVQKMKMGGAL